MSSAAHVPGREEPYAPVRAASASPPRSGTRRLAALRERRLGPGRAQGAAQAAAEPYGAFDRPAAMTPKG